MNYLVDEKCRLQIAMSADKLQPRRFQTFYTAFSADELFLCCKTLISTISGDGDVMNTNVKIQYSIVTAKSLLLFDISARGSDAK